MKVVRIPSALLGVLLTLTLLVTLLVVRLSPVTAGEVPTMARRSEEESRIIQVYKAANEAVVFITTITLSEDPMDFVYSPPRQGTGSGVIVDSQKGIILTNLHVIRGANKIEVSLADGQNYHAKLLGYDDDTDIAALQLLNPPRHLTSVPFGDSSRLEVGQRVLAIGNPFGLNRTLTTGVVSSLERSVRTGNNTLLRGLVQTDAAINPGNSGGPLLDTEGRLVGINTAILSASGESAGIGFAMPINQIKRILRDLVEKGRVLRPSMGWVLVDTDQGPMVLRVLPRGPAAEADVAPIERIVHGFLRQYVRDVANGDLILKVNGKRVNSRDDVEEIISNNPADRPVKLTLRRGGIEGHEREVTVKPVLK